MKAYIIYANLFMIVYYEFKTRFKIVRWILEEQQMHNSLNKSTMNIYWKSKALVCGFYCTWRH